MNAHESNIRDNYNYNTVELEQASHPLAQGTDGSDNSCTVRVRLTAKGP